MTFFSFGLCLRGSIIKQTQNKKKIFVLQLSTRGSVIIERNTYSSRMFIGFWRNINCAGL